MSRTFHWTPVAPPPPIGGSISLGFAGMLARRRGGEYSNGDGGEVQGMELDHDTVPWLEGVRDASADNEIRADAIGLLAAIREHGTIRLSVDR